MELAGLEPATSWVREASIPNSAYQPHPLPEWAHWDRILTLRTFEDLTGET